MGDRHGLILDYGGVLTTSPFASFEAFCAAEGLPPDAVQARFRDDPSARATCSPGSRPASWRAADFEPRSPRCSGVAPERLLRRMFGGMAPDAAMLDGVRALRRRGVRMSGCCRTRSATRRSTTATRLAELFDDWVISSEVGLRKPDPAIYALAAERLGLPPAARASTSTTCRGNLKPARALGMATVLHRGDAAATLAEVRALLR